MNKELFVSSTPHETKVALVEDDQLAEVFYERENEYTLAGSIYKGRVTRVLPGMQSAFVDIGLERDAFLYVSDFLELTDDEDSEEFGEIPAPPNAVNLTRQSQPGGETTAVLKAPVDESSEFIAAVEDLAAGDSEGEGEGEAQGSNTSPEDSRDEGGARRWRGRRRRGGRRGGRDERPQRTEVRTEAPEPVSEPEPIQPVAAKPVVENRPAPQRYAPIVLPGESISKYRNRPPVAEVETVEEEKVAAHVASYVAEPVEEFAPPVEPVVVHEPVAHHEVHEEVYEETEEVVEAPAAEAPVSHHQEPKSVAHAVVEAAPETHVQPLDAETHAVHVEEVVEETESVATGRIGTTESHSYGTIEVAHETSRTAEHEASAERETPEVASEDTAVVAGGFVQHAAPAEAPQGRTLEHETLDDDEMEFHPMPENLEALSEVAGDLDIEMEEQTLDDDNGYSERWIPKVADVDEDEVVAAEERGETRFVDGAEEEEDENGEQESTGRAELRTFEWQK